jgi:3-dehydroquinate dehydratase
MLDSDLAAMYQVEVKRLNEQVRRNIERFPENFRFQLSDSEFHELVAICDRFKTLKHSSVNPHAFTEAGVAMLSAVLHTPIAIQVPAKYESF